MAGNLSAGAAEVRRQIRAAVQPGGKQVMVKITGGGRGMKAIEAHLRYIGRQGKDMAGGRGETLELEDEQGQVLQGHQAIKDLADDWRLAGSYIPDESDRKEAFNIILSMPEGTPADAVLGAAREFAREEFAGHKYVFVLHQDTKSPHVHLAVRAERGDGLRLNPRKADLQRWRERFAARLQDRGVNALATPARARGTQRTSVPLWQERAPSRVRTTRQRGAPTVQQRRSVLNARRAWIEIERALRGSPRAEDKALADPVAAYIRTTFPLMRQRDRSGLTNKERSNAQRRFGARTGRGAGARGIREPARGVPVERYLGRVASLAQAQSIDGLRDLSSLPVVRLGAGSEVLLPGDAPRVLEHQGAERADALRRQGSSADGGWGRVDARLLGGLDARALASAVLDLANKAPGPLAVEGDETFRKRVAEAVAAASLRVEFADPVMRDLLTKVRDDRSGGGRER
jgi:hypothetical protein